jgi:hypothetical protein
VLRGSTQITDVTEPSRPARIAKREWSERALITTHSTTPFFKPSVC